MINAYYYFFEIVLMIKTMISDFRVRLPLPSDIILIGIYFIC